jgi:YidC/Oxa1 family membrane protein insertase
MCAMLVFTVLAFTLLFGAQSYYKQNTRTPSPVQQIQSSTNQPIDQPAPSHSGQPQTAAMQTQSLSSLSSITAVRKSETTGQLSQAHLQFGWLTFIAMPLYWALSFLYQHGIGNWGWDIIIFTVFLNLLMFLPRIYSLKSSLKMMRVQPKVNALKKRYAHLRINDPRRAEMNTEMMALYKAEGVNMFGGCLPTLVSLPLLFAYFQVLKDAAELHHAHWFWLTDLSSPDPLHILPILIIVTMFLTQFITPTPGMDPTQRRMLAILMPVIMGFSLWRYASGIALYWATGNLVNLIIQLLINRTRMGKEMHTIAAMRQEPRP